MGAKPSALTHDELTAEAYRRGAHVGDRFDVRWRNASWYMERTAAAWLDARLQLVDHRREQESDTTGDFGSQVWTIQALAPGDSTFVLAGTDTGRAGVVRRASIYTVQIREPASSQAPAGH